MRVAVGAWVIAVACGMSLLYAYAFAAAQQSPAPRDWPADIGIEPASDRATLVIVLHPHCPCSRASVAELAWLVTRLHGHLRVFALFVIPPESEPDWERSELRDRVADLDGVLVVDDADGEIAEHFGATTSGQTYLFGPDGTRWFHGGITPSRGHQGDNVGRRRIVALVTGEHVERDESDVFGCPLTAEASP